MYALKYHLSISSERGNEYDVLIYKLGYAGSVIRKKLGVAPVLTIEDSDGRIQGSSITFAIQADVQGELEELYTTNNKEYKVELHRNGKLYWIGYLLPELYSEEYIAPPYNVSVTATDQLALLKEITLDSEVMADTILAVLYKMLMRLQMEMLPIVVHQNLSNSSTGLPMLVTSIINNAAYNGMTAYDALNSILLSCNCYMYQMNGEWVISAATNDSQIYWREEQEYEQDHLILGRMYNAPVYPDGSLIMVNDPAMQGVDLSFWPLLKSSLLVNAECTSKDGWNYTIDDEKSLKYPGEVIVNWNTSMESKYVANFWRLPPKNLHSDSSLQIWQDVLMPVTVEQLTLSFKYFNYPHYKEDGSKMLLLLAVMHIGADGVTRQLTTEGWVSNPDVYDEQSYITVGPADGGKFTDVSTFSQASMVFTLPPVVGTLRVGFINVSEGVMDNADYSYYVTDVFVTVGNIVGYTANAMVQASASQRPIEILLAYSTGEYTAAQKLQILNTIENDEEEKLWYLNGRVYDAYLKVMLQELSRYYCVKKMQLQGGIQGKNLLAARYTDSFSGKTFRLKSASYNLLNDTASVTLEEVPVGFVEYDTTIEVVPSSGEKKSVGEKVVSATTAVKAEMGSSITLSANDSVYKLKALEDEVARQKKIIDQMAGVLASATADIFCVVKENGINVQDESNNQDN